MTPLHAKILEQLVAGLAEPVLVARIDSPDWPVVLSNAAFAAFSDGSTHIGKPFADVIERLGGRELALEVSESVRAGEETSISVELGGRDYLLALKPIYQNGKDEGHYAVAYWRGAAGSRTGAIEGDTHQALLKAKRRIRDLARDDTATGLLNESAFREVLHHDWAVAAREKTSLALVCFSLDDFTAYHDVFGQHAADSCVRRVAQTIRRRLRRASDVAARIGQDQLIVLSHASGERGLDEFAARIAESVRELGLHHPRSGVEKFVTVTYRTCRSAASGPAEFAEEFLASVTNPD